MSVREVMASLLLIVGGFFYLAGTVGLLRFPDVHSRLHALTKADSLGLFFVCLALALLSASWRVTGLLLAVWLLALLAASVSAQLVARRALQFDAKAPDAARHEPADRP